MERILEMPAQLAPAGETPSGQLVSDAAQEETVEISPFVNHAYQTFYFAFIAFFAIFGIDKFLHLLTNWDQYVAPQFMSLTSFHGQFLTMFAGFVEVLLAVCVAIRPRAAAWLVAGWFVFVSFNLVLHGGMFDLAVMNAFLAVVSISFGFLAQECN